MQPHESTIQALEPLLHAVKGCEQAITDDRAKHGGTTEIIDLDGTSAMWRKR